MRKYIYKDIVLKEKRMFIKKLLLSVVVLVLLALPTLAQDQMMMLVAEGEDVEIVSDGQAYESFLAAPTEEGSYPAVVLIHSFNGLEEGYRDMTVQFAQHGFVVLAVGWQTFERSPSDAVVEQLLRDSIDYLSARDDVDAERIGLTGFCAGGRYTMRFLPIFEEFGAGVAWYGFPYSGDTAPADLIDDLSAPMLVIHGTDDQASPIADIFRYATELADADKSFELKVYEGEPHGFMISGGELRTDEVAADAFNEMIRYFERKL
jgi:carboxymethylenebutenolidase